MSEITVSHYVKVSEKYRNPLWTHLNGLTYQLTWVSLEIEKVITLPINPTLVCVSAV